MSTAPYARNFALLISGKFTSSLMTQLFNFAQALYVMDISGSAAAFSAVLIAGLIPRALLNLFAGVLVDRLDPKRLIVSCDGAAAVIVFVFWGLFQQYPHSVALFVVLSLLLAAINTLFTIAVQTATERIVGPDRVLRANAVQQSMKSIIVIFAPVLGALIYAKAGMGVVFLLNGLSFLISGLAESAMSFPKTERTDDGQNIGAQLREIIDYLRGEPALRGLFVIAIVLQMFFEPMTTLLLPFVAYQVLEVSEVQLSLIQGLAAIGVIAASLVAAGRKTKAIGWFFPLLWLQALLFGAWALPALGDGWSPLMVTIGFVLLQILGRFCNTLQNVPLFSHFQVAIPEHIRGRVFGLFYALAFLFVPLNLWLFGLLLERAPWHWLPPVVGALIALGGVLGYANPQVRAFFHSSKA